METHELDGKPWSIGTRNCRQPDQCPMSNMIATRLKILMKTPSELKNCIQVLATTFFARIDQPPRVDYRSW